MQNDGVRRPAERVLIAAVARRFYLDDQSKSSIAQELGLSRFKVARLLEQARASGLVRIELDHYGDIDLDLSSRLQAAYGLLHVLVVVTEETSDVEVRRHLGEAAASLLTEIVTEQDVLGLAWARSLLAIPPGLRRLSRCPVVQLTGALDRAGRMDDGAVELVRSVGRVAGGPTHFFYAPMILPDEATAAVLRRQPDVATTMGHYPHLTRAVVGVGSWEPGRSTVVDAIPTALWEDLHRRGVRAELSGIQIDGAGRPVDSDLRARTIGISCAELRAVPEVIGVVYGDKTDAVRAAISGGLINSLVVHAPLARALLAATASA